jgi:spermidine synthase
MRPRLTALFAGIFAVAFGTLLFEIALIRILSFTIWYHFGYVVIATALLGFGAAGSFLAVRSGFGRQGLRDALAACALLSGCAMAGVLLFVATARLDPMRILRDPGQLALLVGYQIAASVPFFFAGVAVSLALRAAAQRVDRLYFWDLLGGGLGCLCAVVLMNHLTPPGAAAVAAAALAAAAAIFAERGALRAASLALALGLAGAAPFAGRLPFTPAGSKELMLQVELLGARPVRHEWTALFRTDLVENGPKGDGFTWGMSRRAPESVDPPPYHLAHDATAGAAIHDLRGGWAIDYVPWHIFQFPYRVAPPRPEVLVIGVGGGRDVVVAQQMGARRITGVDLDPVALDWLENELDAVSAGLFRQPHVRLVAAEGRHFVQSTDERYDLIQLTGVDTLSAVNSGAYVLAENYLYTVEAVHAYLDRLRPGGVLSFAVANPNPSEPMAAGRMLAVAREALKERGVRAPEQHLAAIDSRTLYVAVMVRATPFTPEETAALEARARELDMGVLWLPGRRSHAAFAGLARLDGPRRAALLERLRFRVDATRDDRPFFFAFFRWSGLLAPGQITASHASALGQIVLLALLASLTSLGALFILAPLGVFRRSAPGPLAPRLGVLALFLAIGLGFMLFEISLIQRFVLYLGYPTYSLSVTLFSLLVFLGWGSFLSRRFVGRHRLALVLAVAAIGALALFYAHGMPALQRATFAAPLAARAAISALLLAPLGLAMGIFFPLGIRVASAVHEDLVPWAWGINGCASVTAGVLAIVLAMEAGLSSVWALSVALYALGTLAFLVLTRSVHLAPDAPGEP